MDAFVDPEGIDGTGLLERPTRTTPVVVWIVVPIGVVFGIVMLLVMLLALGYETEMSTDFRTFDVWDRQDAELDGWRLPETVARGDRADDPGILPTSTTRVFVARPGVALRDAAEELVTSLGAQGYEDLQMLGDSEWSGSCFSTRRCSMQITVDEVKSRIVVTLYATPPRVPPSTTPTPA